MQFRYDDNDFDDVLWGDLEGSAFGVAVRLSPFWHGQPSTKMKGHLPSGWRYQIVNAGWAQFHGDACGEVHAEHDDEGWATVDCLPEAMDIGEHMARAVETWLADRTRRPGKHVMPEPRAPKPALTHEGPVAVLVACSLQKVRLQGGLTIAARNLYCGPLFQLRVRWAEALHGGISGILSAAYGLVGPDEEIETYDLTLASMSKDEREQWGARVGEQMLRRFPTGTHLIVLAGKAYRTGWGRVLNKGGLTVDRRTFRGVGYERGVLSAEIAARTAARSNEQIGLGVEG